MRLITDIRNLALALPVLMVPSVAVAEPPRHQDILQLVDQRAAHFSATSKTIWDQPELGYQEEKSSALLQRELASAGFRVQAGVAGEPTAFVATYGQGQPVIGIMGEFDALPGLSQAATPARSALVTDGPGHACGHNLLGAGAALAAVALKEYMERNRVVGTLRYYGTPAEEGGDGKVYMIRAGLFRDVDVILHWHPGDENYVFNGGMLAMYTARFKFHGVSAHAAAGPERGRSALDAVMLMGNGLEFMREHIPSNSRVHYVITNGGAAPNVVPESAEMYLYARNPSAAVLNNVWSRILKVAQGAALMTETTLDVKDIGGDNNVVAKDVLAKVAQRNLEEVGGFAYTAEEKQFAEEVQKSLPPGEGKKLESDDRRAATRRPHRPGVDRCRRRELEHPDHRLPRRDLRARRRRPHLAGGSDLRHEHRPEGHGGRGEGARHHRRRFVRRCAAHRGCEGRLPQAAQRCDLPVGRPGVSEAAAGLSAQVEVKSGRSIRRREQHFRADG